MRTRLVEPLLGLYGRVAQSGALENPVARRAFESVYLVYKRWEAGPVRHLRPLVAPGSTVIDVGANIGFFSLMFADWVRPDGRVIAVEPEAQNMAGLRRRLRRRGLEREVLCVSAAAADSPGELRLALTPSHPGDHHIAETGEPVRAVTVDGLAADDPRPVSLLKIDVQGAEALVIAGSRRILERDHPALFVELDDTSLRRLGASAAELIETLAELGYRPHRLRRTGIGSAEPTAELVAASRRDYIDVLFMA